MNTKILIALITGIALGLVIAHVSGPIVAHFSGNEGFAILHGRAAVGHAQGLSEESNPANAMSLMQTDTALCDQPYFVEVYELNVAMFSQGVESVRPEQLAEAMFDHARNSGYFTPEQAEAWIDHIKDIPGQFVDILREDPSVLDSCYNFQVASVGPPA